MAKRLIAAAAALGLMASGAVAQDWTGLYLGAHAGYGWADWDGGLHTTAGCPSACPDDAGYTDPFHTLSDEGFLGGAQVGYNWQAPSRVVLGVEADITWADIDATGTFDTDKYTAVWSKKHDLSLDYFGTARVRVGYAAGPLMPYVTGGLAWGKAKGDIAVAYHDTGDVNDPPYGISGASVEENHFGWTIGGGFEWALTSNLSFKAEYLHVDLGEEKYNFTGGTVFNIAGPAPSPAVPFDTDSFKSELTLDVVRGGLNYKF
jgi:outer membrane immunogenic protein